MGNNIRVHKRELPMIKEWYNSVYRFNKNTTRFLPGIYYYTFKLLRSYFNMSNSKLEKKRLTRRYKEIRHVSGKKLWISNPEIKHFNDKLTITVYMYNRIHNFYKKKLQLFQFTWGPSISDKEFFTKIKQSSNFDSLKKQLPLYTGSNKLILNKTNNHYLQTIKLLKWSKYYQMMQYRTILSNFIKKNEKLKIITIIKNLKLEHYNYLLDLFNKELLYLNFRQKLLFNEFKYNELYLPFLIEFLQTIYQKKIEINIITLKYYYLSASILLQIIQTKIKSPKKRGKYLVPIDSAISQVKTPILSKSKLSGEAKHYTGVQNVKLNKFVSQNDSLNKFLSTRKNNSNLLSYNDINKLVLTNLENKTLSGLFIKVTGRLTKRYKAQRAIETLRFKGTLKNVYSAHRNLSSSLSRGYSNINIERRNINSHTRVGAFGLTGWVASY